MVLLAKLRKQKFKIHLKNQLLNSRGSSTDWSEMVQKQSIILSKDLSNRLIVKFSKSINVRKAVFEENNLRGLCLKSKRKYIDHWFDISDECFDKIADYLMKDLKIRRNSNRTINIFE